MSAEKRALLAEYATKYNLKTFVETGTYMGDTVGAMLNLPFEKLYSIELNEGYYNHAIARFAHEPRVTILHGDSGRELPKLLAGLEKEQEPVLFWLDGHGSDVNDSSSYKGPILEELKAISDWNGKSVVLADDFCLDLSVTQGIGIYIHVG